MIRGHFRGPAYRVSDMYSTRIRRGYVSEPYLNFWIRIDLDTSIDTSKPSWILPHSTHLQMHSACRVVTGCRQRGREQQTATQSSGAFPSPGPCSPAPHVHLWAARRLIGERTAATWHKAADGDAGERRPCLLLALTALLCGRHLWADGRPTSERAAAPRSRSLVLSSTLACPHASPISSLRRRQRKTATCCRA